MAESGRISKQNWFARVATAFLLGSLFLSLGLGASSSKDSFTSRQREYWAFQEVKRPAVPEWEGSGEVHNPIDAFVLRKLQEKGLKPASLTDEVTLIRRASFDLIGLPPTPDEVDAFLKDKSPLAFEKVVDRLLASQHYGERWARHWLDLARYAESEGFKSDETRPNAWRYRDYVIQAFNEDKPYDRFVREQIAGDELWPDNFDARVATAFNRQYPDESNAQDLLQRRQQILDDMTNTVGAVFLGLTYGCARCHDHKFDAIRQADYYRLQAFYANVGADDEIPIWPDDRVRQHRKRVAVWEGKTRPIREQMETLLEPERQKLWAAWLKKYPSAVRTAVTKPEAERNPIERLMYHKAKPYLNPKPETLAKKLKDERKERWEELQAEMEKFSYLQPAELPIGTGIMDLTAQAPPTHILAMGMFDAPGEEVQPGFLSILDPRAAKVAPSKSGASTGRRTALADWLASPKNPLTARVMVNRIWHYHFGRGIVATPSDFGVMGERPTHPELLDWLASEFVRSGWSIKRMHRLIMTSHTYRQSAEFRESGGKADLDNRLLWRFPAHRLGAEAVRDSALYVSGLLNLKVGGPSVFPPLPVGMPEPRGGWDLSTDPADQQRRSIYIFVRRNARYPMLEVMDMPDTHESCARRVLTITAPQALTYLNSGEVLKWSQAFADRLLETGGQNRDSHVETAYRLAFSRAPDGWEMRTGLAFLDRQAKIIREREAAGGKLALPTLMPDEMEPAEGAALVDFCHALLNSNEFVFRF